MELEKQYSVGETESLRIRPGIVTSSGETIYPTGTEWLLAFALKGCQWAIDALQSPEMELARQHAADPIETI